MKSKRIKVPVKPVRTRAEMESLVSEIAALKIRETQARATLDAQIEELKKASAPYLGDLAVELSDKMEIARAWADANPSEFSGRSIDMTSAVIGFRTGQPQAKTLRGWTWDRVLEKLMLLSAAGGGDFIRTKSEVDRQALIAARDDYSPEAIRSWGVEIVQEETFFVDPKLSETEKRVSVAREN